MGRHFGNAEEEYSECLRQSHQRPHLTRQLKVFESRAREMRGLTTENNPSLITTRYFLQGHWCPAHYHIHCTTGMLLKVLGSFCGHLDFNKHSPKHWRVVVLRPISSFSASFLKIQQHWFLQSYACYCLFMPYLPQILNSFRVILVSNTQRLLTTFSSSFTTFFILHQKLTISKCFNALLCYLLKWGWSHMLTILEIFQTIILLVFKWS